MVKALQTATLQTQASIISLIPNLYLDYFIGDCWSTNGNHDICYTNSAEIQFTLEISIDSSNTFRKSNPCC